MGYSIYIFVVWGTFDSYAWVHCTRTRSCTQSARAVLELVLILMDLSSTRTRTL